MRRTGTRSMAGHVRAGCSLAIGAASLWLPAAGFAQGNPGPTPRTGCDWTLTVNWITAGASNPNAVTHQGNSAGFMDAAGSVVIHLSDSAPVSHGGGNLVLFGFQGAGTYKIGGTQAGSESHAQFLVEPQTGAQAGQPLALVTGDGSKALDHNGQPFATYPPHAQLTVTSATAQRIQGELDGIVYDVAALATVPQQMVQARVNLKFSAGSMTDPNSCTGNPSGGGP